MATAEAAPCWVFSLCPSYSPRSCTSPTPRKPKSQRRVSHLPPRALLRCTALAFRGWSGAPLTLSVLVVFARRRVLPALLVAQLGVRCVRHRVRSVGPPQRRPARCPVHRVHSSLLPLLHPLRYSLVSSGIAGLPTAVMGFSHDLNDVSSPNRRWLAHRCPSARPLLPGAVGSAHALPAVLHLWRGCGARAGLLPLRLRRFVLYPRLSTSTALSVASLLLLSAVC